MGDEREGTLVSTEGRFRIVMAALERGERAAELLDGRGFDARYWRNVRRQLSTIRTISKTIENERDALTFSFVTHRAPPVLPLLAERRNRIDELEAQVGQLTQELQDAQDYVARAAVGNIDRARMPLTQQNWMGTLERADRRITELEAALTAFCDYQQAARHPWPALDQLVRQGRSVLSTSKEETG